MEVMIIAATSATVRQIVSLINVHGEGDNYAAILTQTNGHSTTVKVKQSYKSFSTICHLFSKSSKKLQNS